MSGKITLEEALQSDIVLKSNIQCERSAKPLDFVYNKEIDAYDLSLYQTDEELIKRLHSGQTDREIYGQSQGTIVINNLFGQIQPEGVFKTK